MLPKHNVGKTSFHKYAGMMKEYMMENFTFSVKDLSREDFGVAVDNFILPCGQNVATRYQTWLSDHEEELLVTLSIYLFRWGYPMSPEQCLATALEMAQKKGKKDSVMSRQWFRGFKKHHLQLVLRKPSKLDVKRSKAANPDNFQKWFGMVQGL